MSGQQKLNPVKTFRFVLSEIERLAQRRMTGDANQRSEFGGFGLQFPTAPGASTKRYVQCTRLAEERLVDLIINRVKSWPELDGRVTTWHGFFKRAARLSSLAKFLDQRSAHGETVR